MVVMVVVMVPIVFSIIGGFISLAVQALQWLKSAVWQTVTMQDAVGIYFETGWLGLDRILQWLFNLPFAVWLIVILPLIWLVLGLLVFNLIFKLIEPLNKQER